MYNYYNIEWTVFCIFFHKPMVMQGILATLLIRIVKIVDVWLRICMDLPGKMVAIFYIEIFASWALSLPLWENLDRNGTVFSSIIVKLLHLARKLWSNNAKKKYFTLR